MRRNHACAVAAQAFLAEELAARPLCPPEMLGSMAAIELGDDPRPSGGIIDQHPLNQEFFDRCGIEVPVYFFPAARGSCCGFPSRPTMGPRIICGWRRLSSNSGSRSRRLRSCGDGES